jgi:hypothetical protein
MDDTANWQACLFDREYRFFVWPIDPLEREAGR